MRALLPHEQREMTLRANYGEYRLRIGPEYSPAECRARHCPLHSRPIEIDAQIDHLIVEQGEVSAMPNHEMVDRHLRGTVVIHGVTVHIYDMDGEGTGVRHDPEPAKEVAISETINLAGAQGMEMVEQLRRSGQLTEAAYRIAQQDILKTLRSVPLRAGGPIA